MLQLFLVTFFSFFSCGAFGVTEKFQGENRGSGIAVAEAGYLSALPYGILLQSDGRGVASFALEIEYAVQSFGLARFHTNGRLDTSFHTDGWVAQLTYLNSAVSILDNRGRYVGLSNFLGVSVAPRRYNTNGTLDTSFGTRGWVEVSGMNSARSLQYDSSGRILLAGENSNHFKIVRLQSNGSLDTTFNTIGSVSGAAFSSSITQLWIFQDEYQRVLVSEGSNSAQLILYRFNTNATIDTSFHTDGIFSHSLASTLDMANGSVDSSGRILVGGNTYTEGQGAVLRLLSNGSLDTSFHTDGLNVAFSDLVIGFVSAKTMIQDDLGRVWYAGSAFQQDKFLLARFMSNGALDTSFFTTGSVKSTSVAIGPIFLSGSDAVFSYLTDSQHSVRRINSSGTYDTSFNNGLPQPIQFFGTFAIRGVEITSAGIYGGGYVASGEEETFGVVRFTRAGMLDTAFGTIGTVTIEQGRSGLDAGYGFSLDANGRPIVVGSNVGSDPAFSIIRWNTNGTLDTSFSTIGIREGQSSLEWGLLRGVVTDNAQRILVTGSAGQFIYAEFGLARYQTNGTLDTSFYSTGMVSGIYPQGGGTAVTLDSDGKVVTVGGNAVSPKYIVINRFATNGALDTSFNTQGMVIYNYNGGADGANDIMIDSRNRIVVGGYVSDTVDIPAVLRLHSNGTFDNSFGVSGVAMMSWSESDLGRGQSVVEDQNGKYVLAGFDQPSIGSALHRNGFYATFRRFTSNGSIDTTFGTSGLLVKSNGTRSDAVFGLALGPDGHYYGGGASVSEGEKHHAGVIYKIAP